MRRLFHQYRYDVKMFVRNPAALFFTAILPLIFLFIFVSIFGNEEINANGTRIRGAAYYIPGIATLAVVPATVLNLAISLTILRERGILKRLRSTPLPVSTFILSRALLSITLSVGLVALITMVGVLLYDVDAPTESLVGGLAALVVGAVALCGAGFALTAVIPSEDAAPPITNAVVLPLYFISGIFIPSEEIPDTMDTIAECFPVKPLFDALLQTFIEPTEFHFPASEIAVLAAWGLTMILIARFTFRGTPRHT